MHNLFSSKSVRTYNEHPPFESKFLVFSIFINAYIETPRFLSIKSKSKIKKKKKKNNLVPGIIASKLVPISR